MTRTSAKRNRANQRLVGVAGALCALDPLGAGDGVDVADADPALGAQWAPKVRAAMADLRRFQRALDEMERAQARGARRCAHCGGPVPDLAGRGARYCRQSCRQRAYELRRGVSR